MATGKIVQIIGAVVDVEFPQGEVPRVYDALNVNEVQERRHGTACGRRETITHFALSSSPRIAGAFLVKRLISQPKIG